MDVNLEILNTLKNIERLFSLQQSEYCDTREAAIRIGLDDPRGLKELHDMGVLPRYQRKGTSFKYKKSDLDKVAKALDNGTVTLKSQNHANNKTHLRTA